MATEDQNGTTGERAIRLLEDHLAAHPHLEIKRDAGLVRVVTPSDEGFDVELVDDGQEATVYAAGWHAHFADASEAAATFMWLLTPKARIVLEFRGATQAGWRMEWDEDGHWIVGGRGRILVPLPFWWPKKEQILQNNLVAVPPSNAAGVDQP